MKKLGEPFGDYARYLIGIVLLVICTFLWSLLLFIPGIIKGISYSMTYYMMRENPGMSGEQAIQRSMAMMRGHKMQYFLLFLSFIGWAIRSFDSGRSRVYLADTLHVYGSGRIL